MGDLNSKHFCSKCISEKFQSVSCCKQFEPILNAKSISRFEQYLYSSGFLSVNKAEWCFCILSPSWHNDPLYLKLGQTDHLSSQTLLIFQHQVPINQGECFSYFASLDRWRSEHTRTVTCVCVCVSPGRTLCSCVVCVFLAEEFSVSRPPPLSQEHGCVPQSKSRHPPCPCLTQTERKIKALSISNTLAHIMRVKSIIVWRRLLMCVCVLILCSSSSSAKVGLSSRYCCASDHVVLYVTLAILSKMFFSASQFLFLSCLACSWNKALSHDQITLGCRQDKILNALGGQYLYLIWCNK